MTDYAQEVDFAWQAVMTVVFVDGAEVSLPLFGELTSGVPDRPLEAFVAALKAAWLTYASGDA